MAVVIDAPPPAAIRLAAPAVATTTPEASVLASIETRAASSSWITADRIEVSQAPVGSVAFVWFAVIATG
jgi:hypothetical protein